MKHSFTLISLLSYFLIALCILSCEKEITVDLPKTESKLVVEGFIEQDYPPFVMLTTSAGFFDPADSASLAEIIVKDADVYLSDGSKKVKLQFYDFSFASFYSITFQELMLGEIGKTYTLEINHKGRSYTSVSTIPKPVPLDSTWFKIESQGDSLGFIWATLSDPPGLGNAYRWYAQRLGKDSIPIAPYGSSFDDKFIDGQTFDFFYNRGDLPGNADTTREEGYFKKGDIVVIRFCTIDPPVFKFIYAFETETANSGNPFAAPTSIPTNITGGALGYWGGYGASYDTVICQ